MRAAAARAASRRGSRTRIFLLAAHGSFAKTSGTRVVLPAPGGATSTAVVPRASAAMRSGVAASMGRGANAVIRYVLSTTVSSPGLTGRSSNHRPGILDCPVKPGNDTAGALDRATVNPSIPPSRLSAPGTGWYGEGDAIHMQGPMSKAVEPRKLKKGDHVFLIDGSSFIFRAYFAMFKAAQSRGRSFTRSDGVPTGAVLTFCNMLWKLLREGQNGVMPTHVAVVFDYSGTSFRNQIYSDYKGHRPDPPDELVPQFPLMRDAVRAFGLIPIEQEGFEADDLIATYARVALKAGADVSIIAGDKDLMQLVRPGVMMFDPMPGNERRIGAAEVAEKFGVPPEKVPDVQALIGDTTDNVPGVPGIGVKTAAQLIGEYGDLETLLARAGEIKQDKRRQALIENAESARLSKKLVTLDAHVALEVPLAELAVHEPDYKRLIAFLKAMEFATLTRRVAEFSGIDAGEIEPDGRLKAPAGSAASRDVGERPADNGAPAQQASLPLPAAPASGRESKPVPGRAAAAPTQG